MEEKRNRKTMRLKNAEYYNSGLFFLTICTKDRLPVLSRIICSDSCAEGTDPSVIVGTGVLDGPKSSAMIRSSKDVKVELLNYGKISEKYIKEIDNFYDNLSVDKYVIMPNHIHILLYVKPQNGPSRTPVPTNQNTSVSRFVSTFKRFCNKEIGENIWQYRSYDHIIRNDLDYEKTVEYILDNPKNWYYDELYRE